MIHPDTTPRNTATPSHAWIYHFPVHQRIAIVAAFEFAIRAGERTPEGVCDQVRHAYSATLARTPEPADRAQAIAVLRALRDDAEKAVRYAKQVLEE